MADPLVDRLEIIDIDEDQRPAVFRPRRLLNIAVQDPFAPPSVMKPCQSIRIQLLFELQDLLFPLGHIHERVKVHLAPVHPGDRRGAKIDPFLTCRGINFRKLILQRDLFRHKKIPDILKPPALGKQVLECPVQK